MIKVDVPLHNKNFKELNPIVCGYEQCEKGHSFGPHSREYYLLHYIVSGNGVLENDRGKYNIEKNQIFVIRPGEITTYYASKKTPWSYIWIGFTGELAENLNDFPDVYEINNQALFFDMLKCADLKSMREEFLTAQIFLLYRELLKKQENDEKHTHRVENFIKCNYMQDISVEAIADNMHLDRRYLSRIFKAEYGISIKEFIINERMTHAYELLKNGYSVRQASSMVGYPDVFNFSKMFKKKYNIPPSHLKSIP